MTTSTSASANYVVAAKYRTPLLLSLIVAGLLGNHYNLPVFFNIEFIFGSVFAMLVLQFFGLRLGILAAAIISAYTIILWNHPYDVIIMTAEVAVVGLLGRRKTGMLLADALYWLLIGMPLLFLLFYFVKHVPLTNISMIVIKQAVNGIANALLARLIFTGYALWSRSEQLSYSEIIYNLLAFFVIFPSLIMLTVSGRADFKEANLNLRTLLVQHSQQNSHILTTWLSNRVNTLVDLANTASSLSPQQMQPYLERAKNSDVNFNRIGMMNKNAVTTAYFPLVDELGFSTLGKNFADRPYISKLRQTLKPMLSEVALSRIGNPSPRVALFAPVVMRGEYGGYIAGNLNLDQIRRQLDKSAQEFPTTYILLDKNGNVIMSNSAQYSIMKPFVQAGGICTSLDQGITLWEPKLPANTPAIEQWSKSFYRVEAIIGDQKEWKLVMDLPTSTLQTTLYHSYTTKLAMLLMILLVALVLAEFISRNIFAALRKLRTLTDNLPVKLISGAGNTNWPTSGIREVTQLIDNFAAITDSLAGMFFEINQINDSLEQRIDERTKELQLSEVRLRQAMEAADSANMAKSRFLSIAAHEFHTPLGLLTVSVDILDRYWDRLNESQRAEHHDQIRSASHQMTQLVDSVITFSRQEKMVISASPVVFELAPFCQDLAKEINAVLGADHTFNFSIAPECSSRVKIDKIHFRHVLSNLLSNAFRFTPSGGIVSLTVNQKAHKLLIEVADSGIGIPEEDKASLFDAFYRGSNVHGRSGLGLGLSIVNEALEQINGSITLRSAVGAGTAFLVEIPLEADLMITENTSEKGQQL